MERVMQGGDDYGNGDDVDVEPILVPVVCLVWPGRLEEWSRHGSMDGWMERWMDERRGQTQFS